MLKTHLGLQTLKTIGGLELATYGMHKKSYN